MLHFQRVTGESPNATVGFELAVYPSDVVAIGQIYLHPVGECTTLHLRGGTELVVLGQLSLVEEQITKEREK